MNYSFHPALLPRAADHVQAVRPAAMLREARRLLAELLHRPALLYAALMILPYAGLVVGLDVASRYGALTDAALPVQFFLSSDGGFGEWLEYALTFAIGVMLTLLWLQDRQWAWATNAALFFWLTLDNEMELHEAAGPALAPMVEGLPIPVEANHIGEALLFLAVGLVWLAGLALSLRAAQFRAAFYSLLLAGCIAATAFFGVVVDLLVVWGEQGALLNEIATFVEDGGEFAMIIVTFFLMVTIYDSERRRHIDA